MSPPAADSIPPSPDVRLDVRLDKWLWAARFFKTRALAAEAVDKGRVEVNGATCKPARCLRPGDRLALRESGLVREFTVLALSLQRGPARVAQTLYQETPASIAAREKAAEQRRLGIEPALAQPEGRPTKRDRRDIERWQRWSASTDEA